MELRRGETKPNNTAPVLCALVPASAWVGAMSIIEATKGSHFTPGIFGLMVGMLGDILGVWAGQMTDSVTAFYVAAFLGNWLFWFGLFKAAITLKHKLKSSR